MSDQPSPHILLVDDEPTVSELAAFHLERAGYAVTEAATGEEALARAAEIRPDLILLDLVLPDLSGWQVLERLRREPATESTPVILLSASVKEAEKAADSKVFAFVAKPFEPKELPVVVAEGLRSVEPS